MTLIFIVGATATGKSSLALEIAERIQGEIINADSMQLYRGMDIGTAKVPMKERRGIPHHLIDILNVSEDSSVASYQSQAREIIDRLSSVGKDVVVVGGTGLYVKSILDELEFPETDPKIRAAIAAEAERIGGDAMHERLAKLDPAAAAAIPKENVRRVVRALEVIELTGKPFTANLPKAGHSRYPKARQFGLVMDRENLRERIDARVELMWKAGFVDEVRSLIPQGIKNGKTAQAALGYSHILAFLDGKISESEAKEETKRATRQYARRQETWFSRDERITWLKPREDRTLAEQVLSSTIG